MAELDYPALRGPFLLLGQRSLSLHSPKCVPAEPQILKPRRPLHQSPVVSELREWSDECAFSLQQSSSRASRPA